MEYKIIRLNPEEFTKCGKIWNMEAQRELAEQFQRELLSGNRITYVYIIGNIFVGEISLVFDTGDPDYTVKGKRIYMSRLIVRKEYQRRGIGRILLRHAVKEARKMGYNELSVGVDLDNYPAMKLYVGEGFDRILYLGEDEGGRYMKLLKTLSP
ncbi:MAG: GNAT family N-acetyltransferase [Clostridia bacterium]|nr:GNAT family N-acetyltransferase [Clostridia bacterium]